MPLMDSKETMAAGIKAVLEVIKKAEFDDEHCHDMLLQMIKISYKRGRDDVHSGSSSDILSMESIWSHPILE